MKSYNYIWYTGASWDTSRVRAQCLPLFLRGGWGGQLGLLGGAAPIVFQLLIQECHFSHSPKESESEWHSRAKDRSSFSKRKKNSLRLECPDANGPGLLRAGPSGEEWSTPHYTVPVSPQCPQEISPASVAGRSGLQRALLSVSSAQKCSGAGRLVTPSGVSRAARSAVSCRSPASGHRASRSKYTRGQSRETGSLSRSPGGVGALAKHVSLGPAWADSGSLVFLKRWRGSEDHRFQYKVFWGSPVAMAQDLWGQAPLGKSGVHRITWCPSLLSALRRSAC